MGDGLRLAVAFAAAASLSMLTVPLAISIAGRTGFLDSPSGYKAHLRPTPYLGGAAVLAAALPALALLGDRVVGDYWPLLVGTVALSLVGSVDDRVNLSPPLRVAIEILAAYLLWAEGLGWSFLGSDAANLALTAFWVTGVVNAFNLMDNLDGAASSVAAVSAACVAAIALSGGELALAVVAAAFCGALIGFLRFNLARPARIFLGDGGSMAIGFLLAGALMSVPMGELSGWATLVAAGLAVGVPAFDTALVVISRRRRGAPVFSGATDHTTHRLLAVLRSPQAVAGALAGAQACLCALAIEATRLGESALIAIACSALGVATAAILLVERPRWIPVSDEP
jgi:UDP-GlcNAc:undecaprenyl-phosphate GlcNAc-1-phosphate transferase